MSDRSHYPTDLTDEQWPLLRALLPPSKWCAGKPGRPPCELRQVLNGLWYLTKTGCQWRMIPREFGHWSTRSGYFKRWRQAGVWATLLETLRPQERRRQGRQAEPSAGSVDRQSIKTATQGTAVGFDGGKKVKGRKRHILVDTLGLIIRVVVTSAALEDRVGLVAVLSAYFEDGVRRLRKIWVDGAYRAKCLTLGVRGLKHTHKIDLEVTDHSGQGFQVIPWRWVVERTFAWLLNDRRHSRDYERLPENSEALIQISMIRLLLKRLA